MAVCITQPLCSIAGLRDRRIDSQNTHPYCSVLPTDCKCRLCSPSTASCCFSWRQEEVWVEEKMVFLLFPPSSDQNLSEWSHGDWHIFEPMQVFTPIYFSWISLTETDLLASSQAHRRKWWGWHGRHLSSIGSEQVKHCSFGRYCFLLWNKNTWKATFLSDVERVMLPSLLTYYSKCDEWTCSILSRSRRSAGSRALVRIQEKW